MNIEQIYIGGFIVTLIGATVSHIIDSPWDNSILWPGLMGLFFATFWPLIWVAGIVGGAVRFIVWLFVKKKIG